MDRTAWAELPPAAQEAVAKRTGPVEQAETASTGVMSRLACTLRTASGRVFVKGTRLDDDAAWMYAYEARVTEAAPCAPRLLWQVEAAGWLLSGYEFLDGRHPDLAPDSPDLGPLVETLTALSCMPWPEEVRKKPLHVRWAGFYAEGLAHQLEGATLAHTDVSPFNMLARADGIRFLDWALACPAPPWTDTAFTVVRLIHAGHTPEQAEQVARGVPAFQTAEPAALTTFADTVCGVWARRAETDPQPHRAPLLVAARAWAAYRTYSVA
ncbi:phosphotransferase [Streptomyces spectabilis]|uniref:phosphotransferase n=1 Tax=Streptomyces spectabilis TaxID=68270 RepID=UPI0033CB317E